MGHVVFTPVLSHFRFEEDDGSAPNGTPIAAQDTNITRVTSSPQLRLRVMIQETGGTLGTSTDDWALLVSHNGGLTDAVTTSSAVVKAFDSSFLTEGGLVTPQLTGGTGLGQSGKLAEDGVVDDWLLDSTRYGELLFTIELVPADLADADTIEFLLTCNGSAISQNFTPQITVDTFTAPVALTINNATSKSNAAGFQNGPNLIPDTGFDNAASWFIGSSWAVSGGAATATSADSSSAGILQPNPTITPEANVLYGYRVNISAYTSGELVVGIGGTNSAAMTSAGVHEGTLLAATSISVRLFGGGALPFTGEVTSFEVWRTDAVDLTYPGAVPLSINSASSASFVDSLLLAPKTALVLSSAVSAALSDNVVLALGVVPLDIAIMNSASLVDAMVLSPKTALVLGDASSASQADNLVLAPKTALVLGDALSASLVDNLALGFGNTALAPADVASLSFTTVPTLAPKTALVLADALSLAQVDSILLAPKTSLVLSDAVSSAQVDSIALTTETALVLDNAVSSSSSDSVSLGLAFSLNIAVVASTTQLDGLTLSSQAALVLGDAVSLSQLDGVALAPQTSLVLSNAVSAAQVDGLTLAPQTTLIVDSLISSTLLTAANLPVPLITPDVRVALPSVILRVGRVSTATANLFSGRVASPAAAVISGRTIISE